MRFEYLPRHCTRNCKGRMRKHDSTLVTHARVWIFVVAMQAKQQQKIQRACVTNVESCLRMRPLQLRVQCRGKYSNLNQSINYRHWCIIIAKSFGFFRNTAQKFRLRIYLTSFLILWFKIYKYKTVQITVKWERN